MIRYDKNLLSYMNKIVNQYNRKIDSLKGMKGLPEKISAEDLRDQYLDRGDLLKRLQELQLYSKQGSEEVVRTAGGVNVTQYELDLIRSERDTARRSLAMQRYLMEKDLDVFQKQTDDIYLNLLARQNVLAKELDNIKSKREFNNYIANIQSTIFKATEDRNFYAGFFSKTFQSANFINYDQSKLDEIYKKLRTLPPSKLIKLTQLNSSIKYLKELPPSPKKGETYVEPSEIEDVLNNIYNNIDDIVASV